MLSVQGPCSQRELVVATTRDGLAAVDGRGRRGGRPQPLPIGARGRQLATSADVVAAMPPVRVLRTTVYGR